MSYYNGPKIITNGLVLYLDAGNIKSYPGTGTTWNDISNNSLNFTGDGTRITSLSGAGSGSSWSTNTTGVLNTDTHSIFFKIRFNSTTGNPNGTTGTWEKIFSFNAGGSDRSPGIWRYPDNRIIHWRYDPSNSGVDITSTGAGYYFAPGTEFALNTWYYVGTTKNGATATAYVNGLPVGFGTVSSPKTAGSAAITLFEYYTASLCNIDNLTVYNRVLTDTEILQNFNSQRSRFRI